MVALDTIEWNGLVFGHDHDADAFLDEGVAGFGHGMHRLPRMDRLAGGQALGISAPGAMVPEADLWVTTDKLAVLRSRMEARPMPSDLLPLSWRGLGWPADVDLCVYAKPLGFDFEVLPDDDIAITGKGIPRPATQSMRSIPEIPCMSKLASKQPAQRAVPRAPLARKDSAPSKTRVR